MIMQNCVIDEDESLWFFMLCCGDVVVDFVVCLEVNISYVNLDDDSYVFIFGCVVVVDDLVKVNELWIKMVVVWFFGGQQDLDLLLVCVCIVYVYYWDVKESKLCQFYEMGKVVLIGKLLKDLGELGDVVMGGQFCVKLGW